VVRSSRWPPPRRNPPPPTSGEWLLWETNQPEDTAVLRSIECELPPTEVYDRVEFDEEKKS